MAGFATIRRASGTKIVHQALPRFVITLRGFSNQIGCLSRRRIRFRIRSTHKESRRRRSPFSRNGIAIVEEFEADWALKDERAMSKSPSLGGFRSGIVPFACEAATIAGKFNHHLITPSCYRHRTPPRPVKLRFVSQITEIVNVWQGYVCTARRVSCRDFVLR